MNFAAVRVHDVDGALHAASDGFRIDQCEQNGAHNVTSREAEGTAVGS